MLQVISLLFRIFSKKMVVEPLAFFQFVDVLLLLMSERSCFPFAQQDGKADFIQIVLKGKKLRKFQKFQFFNLF